jgi:hypothetical protein
MINGGIAINYAAFSPIFGNQVPPVSVDIRLLENPSKRTWDRGILRDDSRWLNNCVEVRLYHLRNG